MSNEFEITLVLVHVANGVGQLHDRTAYVAALQSS